MDKDNKNKKQFVVSYGIQRSNFLKEVKMKLVTIFTSVDPTVIESILIASNGNVSLAYNGLLYLTEGEKEYMKNRLPVEICVTECSSGPPAKQAENKCTKNNASRDLLQTSPSLENKSNVMDIPGGKLEESQSSGEVTILNGVKAYLKQYMR